MSVRIIGTGSFVPDNIVTNEEIVKCIGVKSPEWIKEKLGIDERRFLRRIDPQTGLSLDKDCDLDEMHMITFAAIQAIKDAQIDTKEIDMVLTVTCTPDFIHFSYPAIKLHNVLGLNDDVTALQIDSGCGGAMQLLGLATEILNNDTPRNILLVASNITSPLVNRDVYVKAGAWLSPYLFGDGAGAMVLSNKEEVAGHIINAVAFGANGERPLVEYAGGGNIFPGHNTEPEKFCYMVDGKGVKDLFAPFMQKTISLLQEKYSFELNTIDRFFLHQANYHLLMGFADTLKLTREKVAVNVNKYGNTSAAATFILFDEDMESGLLKTKENVLFAAIGAGVHFGGAHVTIA